MKLIYAIGCALLLLAGPALFAQTSGTIAVGVQGDSSSDDTSTFKEQNNGEDSGVFLDLLDLRGTGSPAWHIDSRFNTGGRGWLDLEARNRAWSGGFRLTNTRSWSTTSFANGTLPSGTSISTLVPSVTTLDPLFGIDEPHTDLLRGEAWLRRSIGDASSVTLRLGVRERDGERVPNIGGFSFSDSGTPSFYAPGIETIDSSTTWGAIEAVSSIHGVALQLDAGLSTSDNQTRHDLPAYGESGLLDLNRWTTGSEDDSYWIRVDVSRPSERVSLRGGASWYDVSSTPNGTDLRVSETGALVRDGLRLTNGSIDSSTGAGAAGLTWKIHPAVALTVAADVRSQSTEGSGDILLRGTNPVATSTDLSTDRAGATIDLSSRFGDSRLRIRGRFTTTDVELREESSPYLEDLERSIDRSELRADFSHRLSKKTRGRAWGRWADESGTVDVLALYAGYALSDWDREDLSGGVEITLGNGARRMNVSVSGGTRDLVNAPPVFDPVFDPSIVYVDAEGEVSTFRAAMTGIWSSARATTWGEIGWLSNEYDYDDVYDQPGFAPVSEDVEGMVIAAGTEVRPREGTRVIGQIEWVRDDQDLDRTLTRASLEVAQMIRSRFELFGRWYLGDSDAPRSTQSEYSVNLFALGIRANF
ncbi:MAG: hypothetical protein WC538_20840 [Thermoanaerobaculia bacterium]|jgi:hypothetical protein